MLESKHLLFTSPREVLETKPTQALAGVGGVMGGEGSAVNMVDHSRGAFLWQCRQA